MKRLRWVKGEGGPWWFLKDGPHFTNYVVQEFPDWVSAINDHLNDGSITASELARFKTTKEAKNYCEVCYRMGVHR